MAWSQDDIRTALSYMAVYAGNASVAVRALKEEKGMNVQPQSLRKWRNGEYRELYEELREASATATTSVIEEALETARMAAATERLAIERTHHQLETGECKDPARAARDLSHIKATNIEKFLTLSGKPTEIVRHESPGDVLAGLISDGAFRLVAAGEEPVDATVIDVPDEVLAALPAVTT